jgi:hypothetical protein
MSTIIALLLLSSVITLYFYGYAKNGATPYPEGVIPVLHCEICTTYCNHHPDNAKTLSDIQEALKSEKPNCVV